MINEWKPIPIPMKPANDKRVETPGSAEAEQDAMKMKEQAKSMMRDARR